MDHAKDRRIGGLFFEGIRLSLGGDVVVEVGPDSLLIVKLIDDLSGLLNGLDDEFDLVVQIVYLLDLYLHQVVLQDLLTSLRVAPYALTQLGHPHLRLCEGLHSDRVILQTGQFHFQFLILLAKQDHLLGQSNVFFHLVGYTGEEFSVLPAMDAIVLNEHEHIAPSVVLILPQLLVLTLQALQLTDVLPLNSHSVVLELVPYFPACVLQGPPICVQRVYQVLLHHLQQGSLLSALLPTHLTQLLQESHHYSLFLLAYCFSRSLWSAHHIGHRPKQPLSQLGVLAAFLRRMQWLIGMRQRKEGLENPSHLGMREAQLSGLFGHLFFQIIFHTVQMYQTHNTLGDHPHIPEEAFLFLPKGPPHSPITSSAPNAGVYRDDFRIGEGKGIRRLLFEGWAQETYTQWELQRLKEFDEYAAKKGAKLDPRWDKSWRMRWLLSTGCNNKKCLADMEIFIAYQESVKDLQLTKKIAQHLRNGVFYVSGRDCHYRPILVFDVEKIMESGMNEDELLETQTYFFEYVMRHLLIPGQVENWVAIIDAAQTGLFSLASTLKRSFSFLSDTYRSRMFVCYVVRIPGSISFLWGIIKKLLEEETVRKINFFDDQTIEPLLDYCNPSQLERKFGGTLENLPNGHFWPPREVSRDYKCPKEPVRLLARQEYTDYYNNHTFYNTKFHEENIIRPGSTELRDNPNHALIKRLQKEFKIELQVYQQESFSFEKDVLPYTQIRPPLSFAGLLASNSLVKTDPTGKSDLNK